jgi:hypothetical protein
LSATAPRSFSLPTSSTVARADAIGSGDARVGWAATPFIDLSVGLRGSVQNQQNLTVPKFFEWSAYLALSLVDKGKL